MSNIKIEKPCLAVYKSEWRRSNKKTVIICAALTLLTGIISAALTFLLGGRGLTYKYINMPSWAPPRIVFPIVWSILYTAIGGATGLVLSSPCGGVRDGDKYKGVLLFVIMMIFNFIWSPLFFAAYAFFLALICIIVMILTTLFCIKYYARISKLASAVMTVYLLWLIFAFFLNFAVVMLN